MLRNNFLLNKYIFFISSFIQFWGVSQSKLEYLSEEKCVDFGYCIFDSIRKPDAIIIHSSYCIAENDSFNLDCVINSYKKHEVAAHYIIDRNGKLYVLVNEAQVAFHGGKGMMPDGNNQINSRSIGIEIINTKATSPNQKQYETLISLTKNIIEKNKIKYITGHADIAPKRKTDPWNFDWGYFKSQLEKDSILIWNNKLNQLKNK